SGKVSSSVPQRHADVVNYRDIIDGRKYETIAADDSNDTDTVHVARVIRKRDDDDDYDDNENPNKVPRLERPLQVPKNPLPPLEKPPYFDIIQLPPDLLDIYRALPLGDDGRRRVSDDDFIYECAEFCHSLKHTGAPEITATLNCYFDPKSATTDFDHAAKKASRSCVTCALVKTDPGDRQPKNPTPADIVIPDRPFQVASLDILGPYITTTTSSGSTGKYYSINLVCQLTNMLLCHPTVNAPTSIDVQRAANLPHRLYHYPLQRILTDNASIIKSASNSMPSVHFDYVPVSASWLNGHAPRRRRLRRSFLTTALFDDKTWFGAVPRSAYEINSCSNLLAHGLSPLDMVIDGSGTSPFDTSEKCKLPDDKWSIWRKYKTDCRERTLKAMAKKTSNGPPLEIGDSVLVHTSEPHAKATTPWMPTRRIILEIDGKLTADNISDTGYTESSRVAGVPFHSTARVEKALGVSWAWTPAGSARLYAGYCKVMRHVYGAEDFHSSGPWSGIARFRFGDVAIIRRCHQELAPKTYHSAVINNMLLHQITVLILAISSDIIEAKYTEAISSEFGLRVLNYSFDSEDLGDLPASIDWPDKLPPVRDSGHCESCYAITPIECLEAVFAAKTAKIVPLSVQQLVDCSSEAPYHNRGCAGGQAYETRNYLVDKGLVKESVYPYTESFDKCKKDITEDPKNICFKPGSIENMYLVKKGDKAGTMQALTKGPLIAFLSTECEAWVNYKGGVITSEECSQTKPDHIATLVGYGTDQESGKRYWKIRNNWGSDWGDGGYVKLWLDSPNPKGICGILDPGCMYFGFDWTKFDPTSCL
ncbi:hypothetical protein FOL47_010753, partial [Perkinsus chesapeaki]